SKLFLLSRKETFTVGMNSFRGNYAYMGLPVTYFFMGDHALKIAAIYMAFIVPIVNILSVISLSMGSKREIRLKEVLKFSVSNAIVIGCVVGLISLFTGFKLPYVIDKSIDILTQVTLPLALLNIGASFNFKYITSKIAPSILIILLKLLLLPSISLLIILLFKIEINVYCKVLIIMLSSPCASVNYVLASSLEGDVDLTLSSIISTTILSIITYPLWYSIILNIARIN
ncbi:MAG: AEC family transporter, partial [Deferribacterota bacterium]|nr:AEC family transporter [Deferribacterota bacterium]